MKPLVDYERLFLCPKCEIMEASTEGKEMIVVNNEVPQSMIDRIYCDHYRQLEIELAWVNKVIVEFSRWISVSVIAKKSDLSNWPHENTANFVTTWLKREKSRQLESSGAIKHTIRMQAAMIRIQSRRIKAKDYFTSF